MTTRVAVALLGAAVVAGTVADRPTPRPLLVLGGYRVLAGDFHIHSSMWSDGTLTPWGLVLEAERQGLDVIAVTGHNQVSDGRVAQWFSRLVGGPTVLTGQEAIDPKHHVVAAGIHAAVDSHQPVEVQVDEIHRQGGVAIAVHPFQGFWAGFDDEAVAKLDAAEICHPLMFSNETGQHQLEVFAARGSLAPIGSSDYHGAGRMGGCRTYLFASDNSAEAVLDAIRARRTVVYGLEGKVYGDPALVALAATHPELRDAATRDAPPGVLDWISRVCGLAGLAVFAGGARGRRPREAVGTAGAARSRG